MTGASKMLTVVVPYEVFERLKIIARAGEVSIGKTVRNAIESFLDMRQGKTQTPQVQK